MICGGAMYRPPTGGFKSWVPMIISALVPGFPVMRQGSFFLTRQRPGNCIVGVDSVELPGAMGTFGGTEPLDRIAVRRSETIALGMIHLRSVEGGEPPPQVSDQGDRIEVITRV
jgi:hypothetical protein